MERRYSSAFAAIWRGSRSYGSPVRGSTMLHTMLSVLCLRNGSTYAVVTSGISFMSDLWIWAKPRIEEPSNSWPSVKKSASTDDCGEVEVLLDAGQVGEPDVHELHVLGL